MQNIIFIIPIWQDYKFRVCLYFASNLTSNVLALARFQSMVHSTQIPSKNPKGGYSTFMELGKCEVLFCCVKIRPLRFFSNEINYFANIFFGGCLMLPVIFFVGRGVFSKTWKIVGENNDF